MQMALARTRRELGASSARALREIQTSVARAKLARVPRASRARPVFAFWYHGLVMNRERRRILSVLDAVPVPRCLSPHLRQRLRSASRTQSLTATSTPCPPLPVHPVRDVGSISSRVAITHLKDHASGAGGGGGDGPLRSLVLPRALFPHNPLPISFPPPSSAPRP